MGRQALTEVAGRGTCTEWRTKGIRRGKWGWGTRDGTPCDGARRNQARWGGQQRQRSQRGAYRADGGLLRVLSVLVWLMFVAG